ncbi:MAG: right-handed parallel beta-helix repeat-containing protein, partial [Thermoplasmata archaeon]|nr:right-handed parallel beta-helix repeat-containing protein [Thermoplasmata archaeon]
DVPGNVEDPCIPVIFWLDTAEPVWISTVSLDVDTIYKDGDLIMFVTTWDKPGYLVTADFINVDSTYLPGDETVTDIGGGDYMVSYAISPVNARADNFVYVIPVRAEDNVTNWRIDGSFSVHLDNTPPVTALAIGDPYFVDVQEYVTEGTPFILNAHDNIGPAPSGIESSWYRLNGGAWTEYLGPFNLAGYAGQTVFIDYHSIDVAGNVEAFSTHVVFVVHRDWTTGYVVSGYETISNEVMFACNITVTGSLTLENVLFIMNSTIPNTQYIHVMDGGTLTIRDGDNDPTTIDDETRITNVDLGHWYYLNVYEGGSLNIRYSSVEYCGSIGGPPSLFENIGICLNNATGNIVGARVFSPNGIGIVFAGENGVYTMDSGLDPYYRIHDSFLAFAVIEANNTEITNNLIENCLIHGGFVMNSPGMTLEGNVFFQNGAWGGAGLYLQGSMTVHDNEFINNNGPGIMAEDSDLTVRDCTFINNDQGGGTGEIYVINNDLAAPTNVVFHDNHIYNDNPWGSEGIYLDGAFAVEAYRNDITTTSGTGIYFDLWAVVGPTINIPYFNIHNNTFVGDTGVGFNLWKVFSGNPCTLIMGELTVQHNHFDTTSDAFNMDLYVEGVDSAVLGDILFHDNTLINTGGFYIEELFFYEPFGSPDIVVGQTIITNNVIDIANDAIYVDNYAVEEMYGGTVTWGDIIITGNPITSMSDGIYFFGWFDYIEDVSISLGAFDIAWNIIDAGGDGIYVDWWDLSYNYFGGDTTVSVGETVIHDNDVLASNDGIYVYWDHVGSEIYDQTAIRTKDMIIENNIVDAGNDGITIEGDCSAYGMYNYASVTAGDFIIRENTIVDAGNYAIYFYLYDSGYDMYDNSAFTFGDIVVDHNEIWDSSNYGIYTRLQEVGAYLYQNARVTGGAMEAQHNDVFASNTAYRIMYQQIGYEIYDASSVSLGQAEVSDNIFVSNSDASIRLTLRQIGNLAYDHSQVYLEGFLITDNEVYSWSNMGIRFRFSQNGFDMHGSAYCHIGEVVVSSNDIYVGDNGIYLGTWNNNGRDMYDNSEAVFDGFIFGDNTIDAGNYGIYGRNLHHWAFSMDQSATVSFGDFTIADNTISSGNDGIYLNQLHSWGYDMDGFASASFGDFAITGNTIDASGDGIYIAHMENRGYTLRGFASASFGEFMIAENTIDANGGIGIYMQSMTYWAYDMDDSSTASFGRFAVVDNEIEADEDGIYAYMEGWGYLLQGSSVALFDDIQFNNNEILSWNAVGIYFESMNEFGAYLYDDSLAQFGNVEFNDNDIETDEDGMYWSDICDW